MFARAVLVAASLSAAHGQQVIITRYSDTSCSLPTANITISTSCAALDASSNSAFTALRGSNAFTDGTSQYYASSDLLLSSSSRQGTKVWSSLSACQYPSGNTPDAVFGGTSSITMQCDLAYYPCASGPGSQYNCAGSYKCVSGCSAPASPSPSPGSSGSGTGGGSFSVFTTCGYPTGNSGLCAVSGSLVGVASFSTGVDATTCAWVNCAAGISSFYATLSCSCAGAYAGIAIAVIAIVAIVAVSILACCGKLPCCCREGCCGCGPGTRGKVVFIHTGAASPAAGSVQNPLGAVQM